MDQQSEINQNVERDVRMLIGDMHLQILVLRNTLAVLQEKQSAPPAGNGAWTGKTPRSKETAHGDGFSEQSAKS